MRTVACKMTAGLLGLLASFVASADCGVDSCSDVYVDQIYVESGTTNSWIRTSGTETNLSVCTPESSYLWLDGSLPQKKEVLAAIMLAYSLDKPIYVRVMNGARGCSIAYMYLNR